MQAEVLAARPSSRIRVLAVNRAGAESANAVAVEGKTIPLLQDTAADAAWAAWRVREHDVVILDGENDALGLYSLTLHDLSFAPDYDALLDYLRLAAGE